MTTEIWLIIGAYALVFAPLLWATAQPLFGVLQQEGYCGFALVKWYFKKGNAVRHRYSLLALTCVLLTAILSLCFSFGGAEISLLAAMLGYMGMCVLFLCAFRVALKVPLKRTHRMIRLYVVFAVLLCGALFGAHIGLFCAARALDAGVWSLLLRAVPTAVFPLAFPFLIAAVNGLMCVYEVPHTQKFVRRAKQKLAQSDCVKVGITGSFGKTSVKRFAEQMLAKKYRVLATPASYNTPVGIAKFVNGQDLNADVFLAEMGARKRGDIGELCGMVCPSVAVITGICPQHLETFGSLQAIEEEKGKLAQCAEKIVLGKSAKNLAREGALVEGEHFGAKNIVCTEEGTSFDLVLSGARKRVQTHLLGEHFAEDIAIAGALCISLGMTTEEVFGCVEELEGAPHRLQRLDGANGVHILDDSYNSNVAGAAYAVNALKLFSGKKYVVTPGLVELGDIEEEENAKLGARFVGLDGVILVGETLVLAVRRGYVDGGGDESKLRVVPNLEASESILAEELVAGDCVLFLNDLPDKYL